MLKAGQEAEGRVEAWFYYFLGSFLFIWLCQVSVATMQDLGSSLQHTRSSVVA